MYSLRTVPPPFTYPSGFQVAGISAGIKKKLGAKDLALVVSNDPENCSAAGVFTLNKFAAAPVVVSRNLLKETGGKGVNSLIINAGCANACTGEKGLENASSMSRLVSNSVASAQANSLVMSTGVIGQHLDMVKVKLGTTAAIKALGSSHEHWSSLAEAIMTTDTFPKLISWTRTLPGASQPFCLAGVSKGAGMIMPNMATMLAIICTDLTVSPECLQIALRNAVECSFNAITVDGDTSTNDSLVVFANGAAGNEAGIVNDVNSPQFQAFQADLSAFAIELAKLIVRDGEGATHFITIQVKGAPNPAEAKSVAMTVANSPLVKTAIFGRDANWGRILAAAGRAPMTTLDPTKVGLCFSSPITGESLDLVKSGQPLDPDEEKARRILDQKEVDIVINLEMGDFNASVFTCDFSYDYIKINADYRS